MKSPLVSVIIPVRIETPYLKETLSYLKKQTYSNFEVLVITDKISQTPNPAIKRNLGVVLAKGEIIAFLDDDSFPDSHWLTAAVALFESTTNAAIVGPCLTPPTDAISQQASGLFWQSFIGSGGAGQYRNSPSSPRFVDDYPSVNFLIRRSVFDQIGGFDPNYWPGEDTLLCRQLLLRHHPIYYHPSVLVYHHRRPVLVPHLHQLQRYALHRGFFAKKFPENSLKIGYIIPSLFLLYFVTLIFWHPLFYCLPLICYLLLLLTNSLYFIVRRQNILAVLLFISTTFISHLYYGLFFLLGYFLPKLSFHPHSHNHQQYVGG